MMRQLDINQLALASALIERTRLDYYAKWAEAARKHGASEQSISAHIASEIAEATAIMDGRCPRCGKRATAFIDLARQEGPSDVEGAWVLFRCSTQPPPGRPRPEGVCRFLVDYKIPVTT